MPDTRASWSSLFSAPYETSSSGAPVLVPRACSVSAATKSWCTPGPASTRVAAVQSCPR